MMQRTYRSKRNDAGGLDHRDILNLDDKSSVFDAFYIQNLKQTKRELSCLSSNKYVAASKKIRKRKYTKRIVKDVDPTYKDSFTTSACLTPDKSIRVNKAFDPFDALLNSPLSIPVNNESNKDEILKNLQTKRIYNTYKQRGRNKPKIIYYSSSETDSDKENTSEAHNDTDIRKHELLIEKEFICTNNNFADESINKIVQNIPELCSLKNSIANKTIRLTRNNEAAKSGSPILLRSPLCSTPFKEKYRGKSIYNFSPILNNYSENIKGSTISEKSITSPNSLIPKEENKEFYADLDKSFVKSITNVTLRSRKANHIVKHNKTEVSRINTDNTQNKEKILNKSALNNFTADSYLHNTEIEPFLGFSEKNDDVSTSMNDEGIVQNINCLAVNENSCQDILELTKYFITEKSNDGTSVVDISESIIEPINDQDDIDFNVSDPKVKDNDKSYINFERETMYDTCNSASFQDINETISCEPRVILQRMNNSTFLQYYEKMLLISKDSNSEINSIEENSNNFQSFQENTYEYDDSHSMKSNSTTVSTKDANESFYSQRENSQISFSDESTDSTNDESIHFVTTRRRNDFNPVLSDFRNSHSSDSTKSNRTVVDPVTDHNNDCSNMSEVIIDVSSNMSLSDNSNTLILLGNHKNVMSTKEPSNINDSVSSNSYVSYSSNDDSTDESSSHSINSLDHYLVKENIKRKRISTLSTKTIRLAKSQNNVTMNEDYDHCCNRHSDSVPCEENSDITLSRLISLNKKKTIPKALIEFHKSVKPDVSTDTDSEHNVVNPHKEPTVTLAPDHTNSSHTDMKISPVNTMKSKQLTKKYAKVEKTEHLYLELNNKIDIVTSIKDNATTSNESSKNDESIIPNDIEEKTDLKFSYVTTRKKTGSNSLQRISETSQITGTEVKPCIVLQPGKKWERSLSIYRRMTMMNDNLNHSILDESLQMKGRKYRQSVIDTIEVQNFSGSLHNDSVNNRRSTFVSKPSRSTIKIVKDPNITRASLYTTAVYDDLKGFLSDDCDDTIVDLSKLSIADAEPEVTVLEVLDTSNRLATARDYVLRRCNQSNPILFDECYPDVVLKNCHKIGEGVYGEVFLWRDRDGRARVMKIVPIAGHVKVNGEDQKDFHEIISEVVIAMELSALRAPIADIERHFDEGKSIDALDLHDIENATDVFNEVLAVRCVYGSYPSRLLDLWDLYDECKGSENDNPAILPVDQQYLVLELANAGLDLESYQFNNAEQARALFLQVAFGLAVGEEAYQFEHRDLHWGNVLIAPTEQKFATFVVRGRGHRVARCGVRATIIDYSLSRISLPLSTPADCAALYNDLAADEALFDAVGDYQFEVYRLMREKLGNDWKSFEPYTNILWLHYTVDKMITALRYKRTNTKIHKHYIDKLKGIKNRILNYKSAVEFVLTDNEF